MRGKKEGERTEHEGVREKEGQGSEIGYEGEGNGRKEEGRGMKR